MPFGLQFIWDRDKAVANLRKHAVSFEEASTVFGDKLAGIRDDPDHSENEERLLIIGLSQKHRLLVVVFVEQEERIRIVTARPATAHERKQYEEGPYR